MSASTSFIEITTHNHQIVHGFDAFNKEIIQEVTTEQPIKKLIAVDRILSVTEKFVLTNYGFNRLIYWEYEESYDEIKAKLQLPVKQ